jgi:hypothetical protein
MITCSLDAPAEISRRVTDYHEEMEWEGDLFKSEDE